MYIMAIDPVTGLFIASAVPSLVESAGNIVGGIVDWYKGEPREVRIAEQLGEKELKLDLKRQEAENRRLYGYDDPQTGKHIKGSLELQEEASMRGLEGKLEKIGSIYQKLRQQHGDTTARSLLGAVNYDPRLTSPITPPTPQTDLQRFYTPMEYRGMARGVEGVQSNLLTYLQQAQMQKQAEKAEKKIKQTGQQELQQYQEKMGKYKQQKQRLKEMVTGLEEAYAEGEQKLTQAQLQLRDIKEKKKTKKQQYQKEVGLLKTAQQELSEQRDIVMKQAKAEKAKQAGKLETEQLMSGVEREIGERRAKRLEYVEALKSKMFSGQSGKSGKAKIDEIDKNIRNVFEKEIKQSGLEPKTASRPEILRAIAVKNPKKFDIINNKAFGEIHEYLKELSKKE